MTTFTAAELAKEAQREVQYRRFVYSRRIAEGKMTQHDAERKIAMMERIAEHYQTAAEIEESEGRLL